MSTEVHCRPYAYMMAESTSNPEYVDAPRLSEMEELVRLREQEVVRKELRLREKEVALNEKAER